MPLFIDETPYQERVIKLENFLENHPNFKRSAEIFCQGPVKKLGTTGVLYVIQREYATVCVDDENVSVLGSEDATTCHIIVLRHTGSGVTSLAHVDGCGMRNGFIDMLQSVQQLSKEAQGRIELHCFGGFKDQNGTSEDITLQLLTIVQEQPAPVHLVTACVTDLNDTLSGGTHRPIVYGVGVDIRSGTIFRATFEDKGPDQPLRHARNFTGEGKMLQVYSSTDKKLRIGPFRYKPLDAAALILSCSDAWILENLSTSPHCEPPDFVDGTRATLRQIIDHPEPHKTVFPGGNGRVYRRTPEGSWALVP